MQGLLIIILICCLFPYLFAFLARWYGGFKFSQHHQQPRIFLTQLTGLAERANAIQKNSFESLTLFIPAIIFALHTMISLHLVYQFALFYLVSRIFYAISYLANWGLLRSIFWLLSLMSCIMLFGLAIYFS